MPEIGPFSDFVGEIPSILPFGADFGRGTPQAVSRRRRSRYRQGNYLGVDLCLPVPQVQIVPAPFPGEDPGLRRELRQGAPGLGVAPPLRPPTFVETQGGAGEEMARPVKTNAGRRTTGPHRLKFLPPHRDLCHGAKVDNARKWRNEARSRGQEAQTLGRRGQGNMMVGMQNMADPRHRIPCQHPVQVRFHIFREGIHQSTVVAFRIPENITTARHPWGRPLFNMHGRHSLATSVFKFLLMQ
uniref:Uncharacterized protein n=1 Tax=Acidithiobacillus sulfuriphilus TaxID=1867749 RepID=A0A3M8RZ08_9PROT|nr:hypothetical protein EC580_01115 [Acidithiobacillus sulfuriphilus]